MDPPLPAAVPTQHCLERICSAMPSATSRDMNNPHALAAAQDDAEVFEVMLPPPNNFDIFNDAPLSTGTLKTRKQVHQDQDWHCSTHVWLVDVEQQCLLLQQRAPEKDTFPNRWDISAAGHIEAGSDARETAVRETAEELGIHTESDSLEYAFVCPAEQASWGGCNAYEHVFFLRRSKKDSEFAIGSAEVTSVKWMYIDDLKMAWGHKDEAYVPRVEQYKEAFFEKLNRLSSASTKR